MLLGRVVPGGEQLALRLISTVVPTTATWTCRRRCRTHATLLLKSGIPVKGASERLGDAYAAFTMSVCQHVIPGMQAEAAAILAQALAGTRQRGPES